MKRVLVRFKNGKTDLFTYSDDTLFELDMDVVKSVLANPRTNSGVIGCLKDGFYINVLDIAAIKILPEDFQKFDIEKEI